MNTISILIVNYKSAHFIDGLIDSIFKCSEIKINILIRNNDETEIDELKKINNKYQNLKILNGENIGFGAAINYLTSLTNDEYILIANPDCEMSNGTISNILNEYLILKEKYKKIGMLGAYLINEEGDPDISYGNFPSLFAIFLQSIGINKLLPKYITNRYTIDVSDKINKTKIIPYPSGAFALINRELFTKFGGFDKDFFAYFEETYLCYRLQKSGYLNFVTPTIKVIHHRGNRNPLSLNGKLYIESMYKYAFKTGINIYILFFINLLSIIFRFPMLGLNKTKIIFDNHLQGFSNAKK